MSGQKLVLDLILHIRTALAAKGEIEGNVTVTMQ